MPKLRIEAVFVEKLVMLTLLDDIAVLHNEDKIGFLYGGETVSNDKRGASLHESGEGALDPVFG